MSSSTIFRSFPFLDAHRAELNERQFEAVERTEGPLLILAGAGSGKTRVLTYRIAHLVRDLGIPLGNILAMTFSNKAAREMHDRVKKLLEDPSPIRIPWISTFHSVSARLLRFYGSRLGYQADFAIYDDSDQSSIMKTCLEKLKLSEKEISADSALHRIGEWKNQGKVCEEIRDQCAGQFDENCAKLYQAYTQELLNAQAMDFDDLLLNAFRLLRDHEDLRQHFQTQWQYVLIDEFQDTNDIQYKLLRTLMNPQQNICVVGDDDQSIYGWRGAKIENILNFDKEMSNCAVVKLEQNYRSTGNILKAADVIISKNELRHNKMLWTTEGEGERLRVAVLADDRVEAEFVIGEIKRTIAAGVPPNEIAVFYRINSLSRGFEEECLRQRLPYQIIGGFRFYERKEIKDLLSYFKILLNPADIASFRRTVNTPLRGIGKASIDKIEEAAAGRPIGRFIADAENLPVSGKALTGLSVYRDWLRWGYDALDKSSESLVDLFIDGIQKSKYREMLNVQKTDDAQDRLENIQELLSAVQEFEETWEVDSTQSTPVSTVRQKLRDFLERVSLMADIDELGASQSEQVTFMSLHSAKGLEFKVCFMAGMEEGLFPTVRSFESYQRTEEERRLCYVGITRAREKLYFTRAARRRTFGSINYSIPSRFLNDLPKSLLETVRDENDLFDDHSPQFFRSRKAATSTSVYSGTKRAESPFDFEFDQRIEAEDERAYSFKKGDRVAHPSFGDGIVQKAEYLGSDECLSIVFAGRGLKKVLAKFVNKR